MDSSILMELTADIVSAHIGHNRLEAADLPRVNRAVHDALVGVEQSGPVVEEQLQSAVPVRSSVKPDAIACLECGSKMKMMKRHLSADHGLSVDDYRKRWTLPGDYPMFAPDYSAKRQVLAKEIGLGRKPGQSAGPKQATETASANAE